MKNIPLECSLFLVLLSSTQAAVTSLCGTADGYFELQEGKQDNNLTCTGLTAQNTVQWILKDPSLPNGFLLVASCPPLSSNGTQPVCRADYESVYKPSRISSDTSVIVVNTGASSSPVLFEKDQLVCVDGTADDAPNAGCHLDYINSSENVTCVVQFRNETWTVFGQCDVKKTRSRRDRYRCEWIVTKQSPVLIANVSMSTVASVGTYFSGSCNFTSYLPPDGQYTYRVTVVPGEVTINATFTGSSTIRRPSSTPSHNCPQYVPEGSDLSCNCSVSDLGSPSGVLQWNSTQSTQLRLAGLQAGYSGTHVCQLMWNNTIVQSVEYTVNVAYGPNNVTATVLSPQPFDTNGLHSIDLNCSVFGSNPPASVTWVRSRDQSVVCSSPLCVFTPKPPDDDGISLECRARNSVTNKTNSNNVTVALNYPPTSSPVITANPDLHDTQPVYQGDNITLRCTVSGGKPVYATVITFTCPGKTDTSVVSIGTSNISSSFTFLPVSSDNHGRCVCTARWKKSDWYNQTVSWNINVYTPPSIPAIFPLGDTPGRPVYPFMAGTSGILRCQSNQTGRPEATYSWPVPASGQVSGSNLTFYNMSREDNGKTVKCRASNSYTDNRQPVDDATLVLQVYYKPVLNFSRFPDGNDCVEVSSVFGYKQCIVAEGQRIHINCTAESSPLPLSFKWLSQSRDVYSNTSELMIKSASHTIHNGDFNCTVVTKLENMDSRLPLTSFDIFTVIVGYPPKVLNFTINEDNMTAIVQEKSRVDMKCLCSGRPTPSIRLINVTDPEPFLNQSQPTGDISVDERTGEVLLTIDQVPCEASGIYRCDVNNSLGQDSQNRTLLVYCAPRGTFGGGNITSDKVELSVRMTAFPTPIVKSITYLGHNESSDGNPVKENTIYGECSARSLAPAAITCKIRVINITNIDKGFYKIVFSNRFGEMSFIFSVKEALSEDDQETNTRTDYKTSTVVLAVVLAVVIVVIVVVVIWMWRRQWTLPCAGGDGSSQRLAQQNQINGDLPDQYLSPMATKGDISKEGQEAPLYDALQMQDVGKRSHYEEVQRYQNVSSMSPYQVVSDTSRTGKEEYTYVN